MNEQHARARLPQAYALSLWLLDLGFNEEQIAAVLEIDCEAIPTLLEVARLKVERLVAETHGPGDAPHGVAVFVDDDDRLIDEAAAIARDHGLLLHLIALRRATPEPASSGSMSEVDQRLLHAARRGLHGGVDVVPHAIAQEASAVVRTITDTWGPGIFVVRCDDERRHALERATRQCGATVLALDEPGRVTGRRERSLSAIRRLTLGRAN